MRQVCTPDPYPYLSEAAFSLLTFQGLLDFVLIRVSEYHHTRTLGSSNVGLVGGPGQDDSRGIRFSIIPFDKFDSDTLGFRNVVLSAWIMQLPIRTYTTGNSSLRDSHHPLSGPHGYNQYRVRRSSRRSTIKAITPVSMRALGRQRGV